VLAWKRELAEAKLEAAMKCARLQPGEPPLGVEEAWEAFAAVQFLAERQEELA
jgi:hypothetical protein